MGYPPSLDEMDVDYAREELGPWGDPAEAVRAVVEEGRGSLRHAEGVAFGHSAVEEEEATRDGEGGGGDGPGRRRRRRRRWRRRIFADGEMWEVRGDDGDDSGDGDGGNGGRGSDEEEAGALLAAVADNRRITRGCLGLGPSGGIPPRFRGILEDLVARGYLYGSDD